MAKKRIMIFKNVGGRLKNPENKSKHLKGPSVKD